MFIKKLFFYSIFLICLPFLFASEIESIIEVGRENSELSAISQEKIDATEKETDTIVNEYKKTAQIVEGLKLYNEQKRIQIQAQKDRMKQLDDQIKNVVVIQRQIPPLAQKMLEGLESFVELDMPFYLEEKKKG